MSKRTVEPDLYKSSHFAILVLYSYKIFVSNVLCVKGEASAIENYTVTVDMINSGSSITNHQLLSKEDLGS